MKTIKNLAYRIKRFFDGESGIVERVDDYIGSTTVVGSYHGKATFNYIKDDYSGLPQRVTFRNPLGEEITDLSSMVLVPTSTFGKKRISLLSRKYKAYKPGDNFP